VSKCHQKRILALALYKMGQLRLMDDRKSCHRCLLKKFSIEFFEKHFDKGHQEDFLDEMKREEKGRTLL